MNGSLVSSYKWIKNIQHNHNSPASKWNSCMKWFFSIKSKTYIATSVAQSIPKQMIPNDS